MSNEYKSVLNNGIQVEFNVSPTGHFLDNIFIYKGVDNENCRGYRNLGKSFEIIDSRFSGDMVIFKEKYDPANMSGIVGIYNKSCNVCEHADACLEILNTYQNSKRTRTKIEKTVKTKS